LDQKVRGWFGPLQQGSTRTSIPPVDRVDLRYSLSNTRNVEIPYLSPEAIRAGATVRHAVGDAELRGWKKRMPFCNGADTGFKVTRPERELTSIWCPAVKPPGEPPQEGKQMTPSKERWCTFHLRVCGCRLLSQSERAIRALAGDLISMVAFGRLEPYDGKLSRTVLRGAGAG